LHLTRIFNHTKGYRMKKSLGMKTIVTLFATLFVASTSFVGCVSTDDGESLDPAVAASSEVSANSNNSASDSETAEPGDAAQAQEGAAAGTDDISLNAASEPQAAPSSTEGGKSPVDVASDAAAASPETASLPNAVSASPSADPFAIASTNTMAQPAQVAQGDQAASTDQPDQASVPASQASQETQVVSAFPEEGSLVPYHVRKGDTLASIAGRIFGNAARWHELAEQNNIVNPDLIYVGDVLLYRMDAKSKEFAAKQDSVTKKVVKVASGDSLWTIAERELGSASAWRVIWKDNPSIKNPDVIPVGMQLVVTNWMHVAQGSH
jgi:nucleoid-associated protein YgaU